MTDTRPGVKPANPRFSSGPCPKRLGWTPNVLDDAALGRSHRAPSGLAKLREVIALTRDILQIPADHRIAIVPGSDTGAVEMALWNLLGARGVHVLAWEAFGSDWVTDVVKQLKLPGAKGSVAAYGALPDFGDVDFADDVVFTWNGTTSGVRVPDATFIPDARAGLTICDATSAVFAQRLDWRKLDVATFSWQKCLGGEAAHGMLVLGPRAVERLERYKPAWAMPKLFRMTTAGTLNEALFDGSTINTPSLLCVEDCLDALRWARDIGGLAAMIARADANFAALSAFVETTPWLDFLAKVPATRSNTSVCLRITDPVLAGNDDGAAFSKALVSLLEAEGVAYDIGAYRDAPPGLRIWCGPTVEVCDVTHLTQWLGWAREQLAAKFAAAA